MQWDDIVFCLWFHWKFPKLVRCLTLRVSCEIYCAGWKHRFHRQKLLKIQRAGTLSAVTQHRIRRALN